MRQEIHWVCGDLPKIGKNWTVRALLEVMQMRSYCPSLIDTSPSVTIGKVYAPNAHMERSCYFDSPSFTAADSILEVTGNPLVIKLASNSQQDFLDWARLLNLFKDTARHHTFWFVTDRSQQSHAAFNGLSEGLDSLSRFGEVTIRIVDNIRLIKEQEAKYPALTHQIDFYLAPIPLSGALNPMEVVYLDSIPESLLGILSNPASFAKRGLSGITISRIQMFLRDCLKAFGGLIPESLPSPPSSIPAQPRAEEKPLPLNSETLTDKKQLSHASGKASPPPPPPPVSGTSAPPNAALPLVQDEDFSLPLSPPVTESCSLELAAPSIVQDDLLFLSLPRRVENADDIEEPSIDDEIAF
jgi:hypothetical protein